jgi:5-formyltetrahydrofolate cyclo-ligase
MMVMQRILLFLKSLKKHSSVTIFVFLGCMSVASPLLKSALRKGMKNKLKSLVTSDVEAASQSIANKLLDLQEYKISHSISIYLSMKGEVNTEALVQHAMESNKNVFIPKITGKSFDDLFMLQVNSLHQLKSFPIDNWGIPDPPQDLIIPSLDGTKNGQIHCVIVPGVAFDSSCGRLGHGKGYYGIV